MRRDKGAVPALLLAVGALSAALWLVAASALAQDAQSATRPAARSDAARPDTQKGDTARAPATSNRLPADSRTTQALVSGGRTLHFTATAGALPITNPQGRVLAEIAYVAYTLDGGETKQRPVTFAFNGGPGSASTWLHLGGLGPWRVPLTPAMAQPSVVPTLLVNAESWLDFTDLVFIDPVGTGFSRVVTETSPAAGGQSQGGAQPSGGGGGRGAGNREEGGPRWFWSVAGDVESFADFIQSWLKRNDRLASPKMLVGESYGGFRGPRIAHLLQRQRGVGINAMILISPVLDFESRRGGHLPIYFANLLPSIAAAALERRNVEPSRAGLKEIEDYARGDYLLDLLRGPRNTAAVDRVVARVADAAGLPVDNVRRHGGRLGAIAYMREVNGPERRVASLYDVSMTGFDPYPSAPGSRFDDPFTTGLSAPLTSAMLEIYGRLNWRVERPYEMLSNETNRGWIWSNSPSSPESISSLREVLALDPRMRTLVTHGFTDLVTPYMASELLLDQLPAYGDPARVALKVYPGGHMHYSRDGSRAALRRDAEALLGEALRQPGQ